ncbi:alanine-zipper protein, partial [Alistipes sp. CHKCI003]|uniref:alanine-zipper protein n=1 Tax=Alistipes sp. CHKCI003 TaxID=1780376 RepID=UPI000A73A246
LASSESGMGIAYNPEQGFVQGKIYDPATGRFQKEFDLDAIEQTASTAQQAATNAEDAANTAQQAADSASRKAQEAKDYIDNTLPGEFAR